MKNVLLILYYWPPSGGAGVQRNLKMVKYYREFGWEPTVFTPENAAYPILDESLLKDVPEGMKVVHSPIWEPYELYKRFIGQKEERVFSGFLSEGKKPKLQQRISVWIRGNLFIPDARMFWIGPATRVLTQYLKEHPVDAIISSGPPHTTHMIARNVKRNTGIPWIADFRDPWTNIDFYDQLNLTQWADRRHHKKEASVLKEADKVVTVSWTWADEFREKIGDPDKVKVITNGYDHADFSEKSEALDEGFTLNHIGYLNNDRNPSQLWEALGELCQEIPELKKALTLQFIGKTDRVAFEELEAQGLADNVKKIDYLPHDEVVKWLTRSQVLLLLLNDTPNVMGVIPGKLYEYLASRRPILAIGPQKGDSARIIQETEAGKVCEFQDKSGMKIAIKHYFELYQGGKLKGGSDDIERYTRRHAAQLMSSVLDDITS